MEIIKNGFLFPYFSLRWYFLFVKMKISCYFTNSKNFMIELSSHLNRCSKTLTWNDYSDKTVNSSLEGKRKCKTHSHTDRREKLFGSVTISIDLHANNLFGAQIRLLENWNTPRWEILTKHRETERTTRRRDRDKRSSNKKKTLSYYCWTNGGSYQKLCNQ